MTPPAGGARQRVVLHLGVPKSGTSFLQATLRENADRLRDAGVFFPPEHHRGLFHAALELTGNNPGWGVPDRRIRGTWKALCRRAQEFEGTTVFSNELFSNVTADGVPRMLAGLEGLEVHVVLTCRDLARQLPAEWQEGIKHGRDVRFPRFLRRVLDPERRHEHARRFWKHQDVPDILARWAAHVPAERIHVVTCPPPGAPRELLWERFCAVTGIDPASVEFPATGANTSLGVTAVDVLARVNRDLRRSPGGKPAELRRTLKQSLVNGALRGDGSPRVALPDDVLPTLERITAEWVEAIEAAGYDVVGDLADLTPRPATGGVPAHQRVRPKDSRDLAVHAVAMLAREVAELRAELAAAQSGPARRRVDGDGGRGEGAAAAGREVLRRAAGRVRRR